MAHIISSFLQYNMAITTFIYSLGLLILFPNSLYSIQSLIQGELTIAKVSSSHINSEDITVNVGVLLSIELVDSLHSGKNKKGDKFRGRLLEGVWENSKVVIPPGTTVRGILTDVVSSGRLKRQAKMSMKLTSLQLQATSYTLKTDTLMYMGDKHTGKNIGAWLGGALKGAFYGILFGGKKGAGIGAGAGAAAGVASGILKGKQDVIFEQGANLLFEILEPIHLRIKRSPAPEIKIKEIPKTSS